MSQSNLSGPLAITDALIVGGTIGGGDITGTGLIASGGTITVGTQHWTYAASAPAAGVWNAGDVVFATAPTVGEPVGWSCTVGGEPGTWLGFGTL